MSVLIKGLTKEKVESCFRFAKDGWCIFDMPEIIEVPPHGRLIDVDSLEEEAQKRILICDKNDNQFQKPYEIMRAITLAPTIIPAEGNE